MMITMKHSIYLFCILFAVTLTACEDTLTEKPDSYYEKDNFFVSESNAEMAITGVYDVLATLSHYGQCEMAMPCSDDTYFINGTGTDNTRRDISHYTLTANNEWVSKVWKAKYLGINRANYAIEGIKSMPNYESNTKLKSLLGEAHFLRAMLAFDLVRYWGDVPFKTTYSTGYADASAPRVDRELIYDQIIADLDVAKSALPWAEAGSSPERATQGSARALLMRVLAQRAGYSLHMNGKLERPDEEKRTAYFTSIIKEWEEFQKNGYHNFYAQGYLELFKGFSFGTLNSKESLWEIAFYTADGKVADNSSNWGTYNGPMVAAPSVSSTETGNFMGRANAFFRVVPAWKTFFEDQDERREVMVCTYQYKWDKKKYAHVKYENSKDVAKEQWYPGKWRREWMPLGFVNPNNVDVNFCFLRYSDVVLLAAEAYNETHQTEEAWKLLNKVRERAHATLIAPENYASLLKAPKVLDLPFIDDSNEEGKFRTALYWERGFELAFEGQRKYDLIRWGILKEALVLTEEHMPEGVQSPNPAYIAGSQFISGKHELFPIPLDEMQLNKKLEGIQNPGY